MSDPLTLARPSAPLRDASTMIGRGIRLSRRNVEAMMVSLMLPVMLMLLFVYLFGGALETGTRYVNYVAPGLIILCAGFGSATTAVTVSQDMKNGIVDRFRSMDVGGASMIVGHVVASVLRNLVSTVLVFGVAIAIGFRPHASLPDWVAIAGVLALFMLTISWAAATVGLFAGSPEAANGFTFVAIFLPYASSAFVPVSTMPSWLHGFARDQPCTPVIESVRSLLGGHAPGANAVHAVIWCLAILALAITGSVAGFRRKTA